MSLNFIKSTFLALSEEEKAAFRVWDHQVQSRSLLHNIPESPTTPKGDGPRAFESKDPAPASLLPSKPRTNSVYQTPMEAEKKAAERPHRLQAGSSRNLFLSGEGRDAILAESSDLFSKVVEKDDMCEAIRLMDMSKGSLKAAPVTSKGQQKAHQFILGIAKGSQTIKVQDIKNRAT